MALLPLSPTTSSRRTGIQSGLLPGTTYQYRIQAVNTVGGGDWSAVSSKTTPAVAPAAPTLLASDTTPLWDADVNSITVKWAAAADDLSDSVLGDGGSDLTSYEFWVGNEMLMDSNADNDSDLINELAALVPTITGVPGTATEYTNTGLSPNQTYYYRVRGEELRRHEPLVIRAIRHDHRVRSRRSRSRGDNEC